MSSLDLLARAECSSDLSHYAGLCDSAVLGAAGMAAAHNHAHMAIFRIKYLNDSGEMASAKRLFIQWARRAMINRKLNPEKASRLGVQALTAWVDDVCHTCNGVRHAIIPGTPSLSDRQCGHCKGSGRNPVKHSGPMGEAIRDLFERADAACQTIRRGIDERIG